MARLSKKQIALHQQACDLVAADRPLTLDEREFVLNHWQEAANHVNSAAGAFFTPLDLATTFAVETSQMRSVVDLCAGIGCLAYAVWTYSGQTAEIVCIEVNPDYVAVGRRVLPEATWICANVEDAARIRHFDMAIGNPPFGRTAKIKGPRYSGEDDLAVIDVASDFADFGVFIIPQMSAPFEYSGRPYFRERYSAKYDKFRRRTGITLNPSCGIDCDYWRDQWRGVTPTVEVVTCDFTDWGGLA